MNASPSAPDFGLRIDEGSRLDSGADTAVRPAALGVWAGLWSGRWALMDVSGGPRRRAFVLRRSPRPKALFSGPQLAVLRRALLGEAEKVIAIELGMPQGTASFHLSCVMRALQFGGRVDLLRFLAEDHAEPVPLRRWAPSALLSGLSLLRPDVAKLIIRAPAPVIPAGLSAAEAAVCRLVYDGHSNGEAAALRGVSARTVAKQLSAAYAALGIGNRAELVRRLRAPRHAH